MERVTLRMPKQQIEELEKHVERGEYPNRSEAIRSLVRDGLNEKHRRPWERKEEKETGRPWPKG